MTKEMKQQFTLRITQANKSELTVILYEMLLAYMKEAKEAQENGMKQEFKEGIRKARGCVNELLVSLHFEYELATNFLKLYLYVNRELTRAEVKSSVEPLKGAVIVIQNLHDAFVEVSAKDLSGPVMSNTQSVYAGLTYGKKDLNENMTGEHLNRGFLV